MLPERTRITSRDSCKARRCPQAAMRRPCVVKCVDSFGIEHTAKVEAESLFEAAVRGLYKLDSSFWTEEDVFDRMDVTVEVHEEPTTHTVKVEKLKRSEERRVGKGCKRMCLT